MWPSIQLGEIVELFDSQRIPLSSIERARRPGPYPYYGAAQVFDYIDDFIFDGEYILVGEDGSVVREDGTPFVQHATGRFWVNNHAHVVRPREGYMDFWFLKSALEYADIAGFVTGAAQPKLNQANLKRIPIPLPPVTVQAKIGRSAWALGSLIENNTRRIELLEEMTQALYAEWFVDFRFPGREGVGLVESPLGQIPGGWRAGTLQDLLVLQRGFDLPSKNRKPGSVPVVAATGQHGTHADWKVRGPGVVTGRSGSLGQVTFVHEDFWPLNTTLWVKEFRRATPEFAYFVLKSLDLASYNSGAAVPTLNRNDISGLPLPIPPETLVSRFGVIAANALDLAKTLRAANDILRLTRDFLVPRLLSGEVDLSALNIDIPGLVA